MLDSIPVVTPELLDITRWVADYYAAPWGEVIKAALPPGISPDLEQFISLSNAKPAETASNISNTAQSIFETLHDNESSSVETIAKEFGRTQTMKALRELETHQLIQRSHQPGTSSTKAKTQHAVRLVPREEVNTFRLTPSQNRIIETLQNSDSILLQELLKTLKVSPSTVNSLHKKGLIEIFEQQVRRDPMAGSELPDVEDYILTAAQTSTLREIEAALRQGLYSSFLLHGVTGSGKTEVYIRAMRLVLEMGRCALMLVPEIALTPVFSRRLRAHFGDQVAIFHSSLSRGERFDEWVRVKNGEARVVIGTHSRCLLL